MKGYITVLQEAVPGFAPDDLFVSLKETSLHSLDQLILHSALEDHFGFRIPAAEWQARNTLSEILQYCISKRDTTRRLFIEENKIRHARCQEIRLPHMANNGLSELWLLKELGDIHWTLMEQGLQQKPVSFADQSGNRIYAAFVRVNYTVSALNLFREYETVRFNSSIARSGQSIYYSATEGICGRKKIEASMATGFSVRKGNDNTQFMPGKPVITVNNIDETDQAAGFYKLHRQLGKGKIGQVLSDNYVFPLEQKIYTYTHTINPYIDINGAGLLYFACYPIIADMGTAAFFRQITGVNYDTAYHTIYRDVFYFANCNTGDRVNVQVNSIEYCGAGKIKTVVSMYRESDHKLIARVFTVKQGPYD